MSPDRPAVRIGEDVVSYRQAHETALLWAGALVAGGAGGPVVVLAGRDVVSYVGQLAVLYAGRTVVPLLPDFPVAVLRKMIELAGARTVVADAQGMDVLPAIMGEDVSLRVLDTGGAAGRFPAVIPVHPDSGLSAPARVAPSDESHIMFTSGSTGVPKGVRLSHGGFTRYFEVIDQRCDFGPADVFAQTFNLNFDSGVNNAFFAWGAGATVQVVPPTAYRDLPGFVAEHEVTVWYSTPSAIGLAREMDGLGPGALGGLRWSFFAGESLRCPDAADWQAAAPVSEVDNLYGSTELNDVFWYRWEGAETENRAVNGVVPIGRLHAGHDLRLTDEHGEPAGDEGELWVAGPQMAVGYLDPADEEGRFVDFDGRRWYRTGDRVRVGSDGVLSFLGRVDSQVKVHGWRVELAEVDHAVRECEGVRDAAAVVSSSAYGTELVVFYTGAEMPESALAEGARGLLPDSILPRRYVHVPSFPLNSNRKVDRKLLRKWAEQLPGPSAASADRAT
ncbi:AMP-binding protein [Lentzea sp. JNUCC 0626]|uniref:AMP-binding protein n=1 Tax=Lentzea sp. JNUCC 0626 TaxID=3367513 RepID=UPI0037484AD8